MRIARYFMWVSHVGLKLDGVILCDLVCRNEAISDTRVAVRMASIATEADFRFDRRKVLFPFLECRNRVFFCEAATET
jgi:hypothetical protein